MDTGVLICQTSGYEIHRGTDRYCRGSSFFSLLFLSNNLYIVHHVHPGVAWYDLPGLYRERRAIHLAANNNYLFKDYRAIVKQYAWRREQPVFLPILRQNAEETANKLSAL